MFQTIQWHTVILCSAKHKAVNVDRYRLETDYVSVFNHSVVARRSKSSLYSQIDYIKMPFRMLLSPCLECVPFSREGSYNFCWWKFVHNKHREISSQNVWSPCAPSSLTFSRSFCRNGRMGRSRWCRCASPSCAPPWTSWRWTACRNRSRLVCPAHSGTEGPLCIMTSYYPSFLSWPGSGAAQSLTENDSVR